MVICRRRGHFSPPRAALPALDRDAPPVVRYGGYAGVAKQADARDLKSKVHLDCQELIFLVTSRLPEF